MAHWVMNCGPLNRLMCDVILLAGPLRCSPLVASAQDVAHVELLHNCLTYVSSASSSSSSTRGAICLKAASWAALPLETKLLAFFSSFGHNNIIQQHPDELTQTCWVYGWLSWSEDQLSVSDRKIDQTVCRYQLALVEVNRVWLNYFTRNEMDVKTFAEYLDQVQMFPYFTLSHIVVCTLSARADLGPCKWRQVNKLNLLIGNT